MNFVFDELNIRTSLETVSESPSAHTSRPLKVFEAKFKVYPEALSQRLNGYLKNGAILSLVDDDGALFSLKLLQNSYSYQSGTNNGYSYSLTLNEVEDLEIEKLKIDGHEFLPYYYTEKFESGAILITARIELDSEKIKQLRSLMIQRGKYFNVVRVGISEEVKEMRFGAMLEWSPVSEGIVRQSFILVEKIYDSNVKKFHSFQGQQVDALIRENIHTKMLNALLVGKLMKAGLIDQKELVELEEKYEAEWRFERFSYFEQESIDEEDDE